MISLKRLIFFSVLIAVVAVAGGLTWLNSQADSAVPEAVSVPAEARLDYFYARQNGYEAAKESTAVSPDIPLEAKLDYFYARPYIEGQAGDSTAGTVPPKAKLDYFYAQPYITE